MIAIGHQRRPKLFDDSVDAFVPFLSLFSFRAYEPIDDESRVQPGVESKKQHLAPTVTAERLYAS